MFSLFLIACCSFASHALPPDTTPRRLDMSNTPGTHPVFTGQDQNSSTQLQDVQEMKVINNEWIVVTARNAFYTLNTADIENSLGSTLLLGRQTIRWQPDNRGGCERKTSEAQKNSCNNFIRILTPTEDNYFMICGTNAKNPRCREYRWIEDRFKDNHRLQNCTLRSKCLLDDNPSLSYVYTDNSLYMSTKTGHRGDAVIRRTPTWRNVRDSGSSTSGSGNSTTPFRYQIPLETKMHDSRTLNDPEFVFATETEERILFFFRETALEQMGPRKVTYSRVAQICKNDSGGTKTYSQHHWTTYFKARLNCSYPGSRAFDFDELRHVSGPHRIQGRDIFFAVLTTPEHGIPGSAVCAFSMDSIRVAFNGKLMNKIPVDGTEFYSSKSAVAPPLEDPTPTACESRDAEKLDEAVLEFRAYHPFMHSAVQAIARTPLFMRTGAPFLFSAIDVEQISLGNGEDVIMMYIGTTDGRLLKIVTRSDAFKTGNKVPGDSVFVEERMVYDSTKCADSSNSESIEYQDNEKNKRVLKVLVLAGKNAVMVAFPRCVVTVPKHECDKSPCKRKCVYSGNPYCGWNNGECVSTESGNFDEIEQDIFTETDMTDCDGAGDGSTAIGRSLLCTDGKFPVVAVAASVACTIVLAAILLLAIVALRRSAKCNRTSKSDWNQDGSADILTIQNKRNESSFRRGHPQRKADVSRSPSASLSSSSSHSSQNLSRPFQASHARLPLHASGNGYPLNSASSNTRTNEISESVQMKSTGVTYKNQCTNNNTSPDSASAPQNQSCEDRILPKFPANGFCTEPSPANKKIVTGYSEVENKDNRTFSQQKMDDHMSALYKTLETTDTNASKYTGQNPYRLEPGAFSSFLTPHLTRSLHRNDSECSVARTRTNSDLDLFKDTYRDTDSGRLGKRSNVTLPRLYRSGDKKSQSHSTDEGYSTENIHKGHVSNDTLHLSNDNLFDTDVLQSANITYGRRDLKCEEPDCSTGADTCNVRKYSLEDWRFNSFRASDSRHCEQGFANGYMPDNSSGLNKEPRGSLKDTNDAYNATPEAAFHTLRPPGRMRQKLPRLRSNANASVANLKAVPSPRVPRSKQA